MTGILSIKQLSVAISSGDSVISPVRDVDLTLHKGEVTALVGESGCGKSIFCKSINGLLPPDARITGGSILFEGRELTEMTEKQLRGLRGSSLSMVLQDPMTVLNPSICIGKQIREAVSLTHPELSKQECKDKTLSLMSRVGIEDPALRYRQYPHQFSGGMRQRAVLAIAIAGDPKLLIADEPTTALDATVQLKILDLIRTLQQERDMTVLLVTHDLGVVARAADRVAIMYAGRIVEEGTTREIFAHPRHPYTIGLLHSLPQNRSGSYRLTPIAGMPPDLSDLPKGDPFAIRNPKPLNIDFEKEPPFFSVSQTHRAATWLLDPRVPESVRREVYSSSYAGEEPSLSDNTPFQATKQNRNTAIKDSILAVSHVTKEYRMPDHTLRTVLRDISFQMQPGEIFALVGESGSGKSTLAKCIMNIEPVTEGDIVYNGIRTTNPKEWRRHRKQLETERQFIFQDSGASLNPKLTVKQIIGEPMTIHPPLRPIRTREEEIRFQLHYTGLDERVLSMYPPQLSGGQRQRVSIARALTMEPRLLVADEPISSLDVSIQAQIVNLFRHLRDEHGFSILFIAHDLAMVRYLSDRIGVMHRGSLVEVKETEELFAHPSHPYTRELLSSVLYPEPAAGKGNHYES